MEKTKRGAAYRPQLLPHGVGAPRESISKNRQRNINLLAGGLSRNNHPWLLKNIPNASTERLNDAKYCSKENQFKELVREYTILRERIISEHSSVLTDSQLNEEQALAELFKKLTHRNWGSYDAS